MVLTTAFIAFASVALVLLVVLELMREVLVLRGEVEALRVGLGTSSIALGQTVDVDAAWPLPEDWFVMALVSAECEACATLETAAGAVVSASPESAERLVLVESTSSGAHGQNATPGVGIARETSAIPRVVSPHLFEVLHVNATPTMLLLERHDKDWVVADTTIGADTDWLESRLLKQEERSLDVVAVERQAAMRA